MIEQEQFSHITKSGIVQGKSWTRQILSDAWESTNWKVFCQSSHTVITETIVTKKFTTDEEGAGPLLPNLLIEKLPEVERRRLYVLYADIEAHGHIGSCPGYALLVSHGRSDKTTKGGIPRASRNDDRENLDRRSRDGNRPRTESLRQSEPKRGGELELS